MPSVRNTCCAITLLLNLLMSCTISEAVGEALSASGRRPRTASGTVPSWMLPASSPPRAFHMPATARAANCSGAGCASVNCWMPQLAG